MGLELIADTAAKFTLGATGRIGVAATGEAAVKRGDFQNGNNNLAVAKAIKAMAGDPVRQAEYAAHPEHAVKGLPKLTFAKPNSSNAKHSS